ncbi:MAG: hypothetical protein ACJ79S_06020 [Gemmatimonadaceae bacterium]
MRRPLWSRAVAALVAIWFAIMMAEPAALHSCPMHGGLAVTAAAAGGHHHGGSVPAALAAPSEHAAQPQHGAPAPVDHGAGGHQCTCLGQCAMGVGAAAPAAVVALAPVVETHATRDAGLPDFEYVPVAAAHVLPFANGPPTVVA